MCQGGRTVWVTLRVIEICRCIHMYSEVFILVCSIEGDVVNVWYHASFADEELVEVP